MRTQNDLPEEIARGDIKLNYISGAEETDQKGVAVLYRGRAGDDLRQLGLGVVCRLDVVRPHQRF